MDSRDGATLHDPPQRLALADVENASSARRLAVRETIRALGVETDNPVARDLHADAADPRRVRARAAAVNLGQRHPSTGSRDAGSDRHCAIAAPDAAEPNHRNNPATKYPPSWQTSMRLPS